MKRILKYTSLLIILVVSLLLVLNWDFIYALTNLKDFTTVEGVSYYNTDDAFEVETLGIYGGIIIYVNDNDEVLAINIINSEDGEMKKYYVGDTCTETMEYNEDITSTEENAHTYGCNTIYQKENSNIKDIKKWKSITEFGDIYDYDIENYGYSSYHLGSYIENKFYYSEEFYEYENNNEEFDYQDYLSEEAKKICDNYGNVFPESLECGSSYIKYYEEENEDSYSLAVGSGWYWSSPAYVFKEVVEPVFSLECDKTKLSKDEETTCIIKANTKEEITSFEAKLNTDDLSIKTIETLNEWTLTREDNKLELSHPEGVQGDTEIAKITLVNKENTEKEINIELSDLNYIDKSGNSTYENLNHKIKLLKTEENPETADFFIIASITIIIGTLISYLNIKKIKELS